MKRRAPGVARLFALLAIIAFVVAFVVVLNKSKITHHSSPGTGTVSTPTTTRPAHNKFAHRRTYTVKAGDTLGAIAIKTGVSVTSLEDLNPGLDPEGLVAGQKIKLRQ